MARSATSARRGLEAENRRLRQVLAEVRVHASVELRFRHVRKLPVARTLEAIVSSASSVLGSHVGNLSSASPMHEVG